MNKQKNTKKPAHIAKSYRVRTAGGETLAVSAKVFAGIEKKVMRINGAFVALRGEYNSVIGHLASVLPDMPEHFTAKSRAYFGYVAYDQVV